MLPAEHRLTRSAEFTATTRAGRRAGRDLLVVHVRRSGSADDDRAAPVVPPRSGSAAGPRFGLVVSKSVGNAVVRHRVSRRLRHVVAELVSLVPDGTDVVLRARPAAAGASSPELASDVRSGLRRLGVLAGTR